MSNRIVLPRLMEVGAGASQQIVSVLHNLGCKRPLIVTDRMMVELGYVARISEILTKADIPSDCFADTLPEPTAASIHAGVEMVRRGSYDSIIALGGGSPIDSAKAIGILGKFGGEMRDYRFPRDVSEAGLPLIAIPTTAGTGSEATRFTIITDETSDEKMLCAGLGFMPVAALIDYELTLSLPPRVTADTGIDALTHAIEAYVSRKASLYSDAQALEAMRLLAPNLRAAFHEPGNRAAREAMMLGATLAGIAFSNASVALVVIFGGQLQWFPLRGLTSSNWDELSWGARIVDYLWHITLPVIAMVLGSFAVTAMLTKNAFLEEIRKQYVLTARAKGLSERQVLWKHVFRNALIPIITGFPAAFIGAFFAGSLLIETLFSLDGLGLLSYESVIRRDYPVVLGTLYLFTLIGLVTKLISDLCYVWVDPRVKFD